MLNDWQITKMSSLSEFWSNFVKILASLRYFYQYFCKRMGFIELKCIYVFMYLCIYVLFVILSFCHEKCLLNGRVILKVQSQTIRAACF